MYYWGLGASPDGDLSNPLNYWSDPFTNGFTPASGDTVQSQNSIVPSSGTLNCDSFDFNANGPANQSGSSCEWNCLVYDSGGSLFIESGNDKFNGGVQLNGCTLYGINQLAVAAQVKNGVINGPYTGTLVTGGACVFVG
jgi:hypothetical protein